MTYVGKCRECGKRVALYPKDPWELHRHGHDRETNDQCAGTGGEPEFGTVVYLQAGRNIEQGGRDG